MVISNETTDVKQNTATMTSMEVSSSSSNVPVYSRNARHDEGMMFTK